jgi:hypothetical protein
VAATPETVKKLTAGGRHTVLVQRGAGRGAWIRDGDFEAAGAMLVPAASDVYGQAEVVLKVQRPDPVELSAFPPASPSSACSPPTRGSTTSRAPASPPSPSNGCRARPAPRAWMCSRPRPTSPAIAR